ncbi:hypothetical protein [Ignavibacterium sp.]|nr:hypothetical protein [Ignavibacterium sp.]
MYKIFFIELFFNSTWRVTASAPNGGLLAQNSPESTKDKFCTNVYTMH